MTRGGKKHPQLLDSPGRSVRSTANIAGLTSNVGNGTSSSISSSSSHPTGGIPNPKPLPLLPPPAAFPLPRENIPPESGDGKMTGERPDTDTRLSSFPGDSGLVLCTGLVGADPPTIELGESKESSPTENEFDRPCICLFRCCSGGDDNENDAEEGGLSEDVISMLPPPTTARRLSNAARTALSAWCCSGVGWTPRVEEGEVSVSVPCNWA